MTSKNMHLHVLGISVCVLEALLYVVGMSFEQLYLNLLTVVEDVDVCRIFAWLPCCNLCICFVICPSVSCCSSHIFHLCCCYSSGIPGFNSPEAEGSNPTTGLTLLWAPNPFRGNFNHWQVSRKEARQIFFKENHDSKREK